MNIFQKWFDKPKNNITQQTETGVPTFVPLGNVTEAYKKDAALQRCVNMLIDCASQLRFDVKPAKTKRFNNGNGLSQKSVTMLLNDKPNDDMSQNQFMRVLIQDLLFTGIAVIYHDKKADQLYPFKSQFLTLEPGTRKLVNKVKYADKYYNPEDCIIVVDNGFQQGVSYLTGNSRIMSVLDNVNNKLQIKGFQNSVLNRQGIIGHVVETDAILGKKLKQRYRDELRLDYNPRTGKHSILILDAGMKYKTATTDLSGYKTDTLTDSEDKQIALGLGVPYCLLTDTSNSNIDESLKQFYRTTVTTLVEKFVSAFELHFGMDVKIDYSNVPALQSDIKKLSDSVATKVNNGLITPNEGRVELRYETSSEEGMDKIRVPQNIAGSASNPAIGGAPDNGEE